MPIIPDGGTRDMRADLLPAPILPLFDDHFVGSCDLLEEFIGRLAVQTLDQLGAGEALAGSATVPELVQRLGLDEAAATVPLRWLLDIATSRGAVQSDQTHGGTYQLAGPLPKDDCAKVRAQQEAHDASTLPSYDIAEFAAESYPACLRGEISGERALFAPQRLAHWARYFSNGNPLYAINNRIPAMVAADTGPATSILELGGGLGSGGEALVDELEKAGHVEALEHYRFTDISPVFLRRGQRLVEERLNSSGAGDGLLSAGRVDIDRPLESQGVEPESFELIYAVNTVHVARDLAATLGEIYRALEPGGRLVLGEGIRPFTGQAVYSELVFLLLESFRSPVLDAQFRPTGGFLTPENWIAALENVGFKDIEIVPDIRQVREHYPSFLVAAVSARKSA